MFASRRDIFLVNVIAQGFGVCPMWTAGGSLHTSSPYWFQVNGEPKPAPHGVPPANSGCVKTRSPVQAFCAPGLSDSLLRSLEDANAQRFAVLAMVSAGDIQCRSSSKPAILLIASRFLRGFLQHQLLIKRADRTERRIRRLAAVPTWLEKKYLKLKIPPVICMYSAWITAPGNSRLMHAHCLGDICEAPGASWLLRRVRESRA